MWNPFKRVEKMPKPEDENTAEVKPPGAEETDVETDETESEEEIAE